MKGESIFAAGIFSGMLLCVPLFHLGTFVDGVLIGAVASLLFLAVHIFTYYRIRFEKR